MTAESNGSRAGASNAACYVSAVSARQRVLLAILVVVAAGIGWLALRTRQPPMLPADAAHSLAPDVPACLTCHGSGGPSPRGVNHPLGEDCGRCHGAQGRSAG